MPKYILKPKSTQYNQYKCQQKIKKYFIAKDLFTTWSQLKRLA